jgi:hypothetical protein
MGSNLGGVTMATGDGGGDFFILSSDNTGLGTSGPGGGWGGNLVDPLARGGNYAVGQGLCAISASEHCADGGRGSGGAFVARDQGSGGRLNRDGRRRWSRFE